MSSVQVDSIFCCRCSLLRSSRKTSSFRTTTWSAPWRKRGSWPSLPTTPSSLHSILVTRSVFFFNSFERYINLFKGRGFELSKCNNDATVTTALPVVDLTEIFWKKRVWLLLSKFVLNLTVKVKKMWMKLNCQHHAPLSLISLLNGSKTDSRWITDSNQKHVCRFSRGIDWFDLNVLLWPSIVYIVENKCTLKLMVTWIQFLKDNKCGIKNTNKRGSLQHR